MNKLLRLFFFSLKRVHYHMPTLYTTTEIKCQTDNYFELVTEANTRSQAVTV